MPDFDPNDLVPGLLLVAPPAMDDPNFARTVVLLCAHDPDGSFGLVLNDPTGSIVALTSASGRLVDVPVRRGGPVGTDTLHVIHRRPDLLTDAEPLADGLYWGGTLADLGPILDEGPPDPESVRFYLGYAGWGPGQLAAEFLDGGWLLHPASADLVFGSTPVGLWGTILREMGEPYRQFAHYPVNPRLN